MTSILLIAEKTARFRETHTNIAHALRRRIARFRRDEEHALRDGSHAFERRKARFEETKKYYNSLKNSSIFLHDF